MTAEHGRLSDTLQEPLYGGIDVQVLLLHGMGGKGKSTLAKVAYRVAQERFGDGNCGYCLLDPDKSNDKDHLKAALRPMLSHLKLEFNAYDGVEALRKKLAKKQEPVFLLVDDVLNNVVADSLLGGPGQLASLLPKG